MDNSAILSIVAICISAFALGWNVYRDVVLRARVRVRCAVVEIWGNEPRSGKPPTFVRLAVTNHGPGPVEINSIVGKMAGGLPVVRKTQHFVVMQDAGNPLTTRLPCRLDVGQTATILLPYEPRSFLKSEATHIGVTDSFSRVHYAPAKDLKTAKEQFRTDFPRKD